MPCHRARAARGEDRLAEAQAAAAYWSAWSPLGLRFATRDSPRVPEHWRTFGTRASPLTGTSRVAANPANAILNYLYAILEAEARLACLALGLDPGLGVLHGDLKARDSLALDVMEPVRPQVDAFVLDLLGRQVFRAADLHQTRQGACRVLEPLTHRLAETGPTWAQRLGPVVERVARLLVEGGVRAPLPSPTPLTGSNRSRRWSPEAATGPAVTRAPRPPRACLSCGAIAPSRTRRYCDDCLPEVAEDQRAAFVSAGRLELKRQRAAWTDRSHGGDAGRRRAAEVAESRRAAKEWERSNGPAPDPEAFRSEVLPLIQGTFSGEARRADRAVATLLRRHLARQARAAPEVWERLVSGGSSCPRP